MFYTFRFYSRTRQRRPFGNRCLEHFPGEYDQFRMIKLRFTAPGSAGYVHIPQGVTVFHKSLATHLRPRVYIICIQPPPPLLHTLYTLLIVADVSTLARPDHPPLERRHRVSRTYPAVRNLPPPNLPPPTRILCKHRLTTPPQYSPVILSRTHAQDALACVFRVFIIWIFPRRAKKRATAAPVAGVFPRPVLRPKIELGVAKNLKKRRRCTYNYYCTANYTAAAVVAL